MPIKIESNVEDGLYEMVQFVPKVRLLFMTMFTYYKLLFYILKKAYQAFVKESRNLIGLYTSVSESETIVGGAVQLLV